MSYDVGEAKGIIEGLRSDFSELYRVCRERWDIVHARHDERIKRELAAAGYKTIVTTVSREVGDFAAPKWIATLQNQDYAFHVEAREGDKAKADRMEVSDANLIVRNDADKLLSYQLHRHQSISSYAPLWIRRRPWNLPKRKRGEPAQDYDDRCDEYRRAYIEFDLEVGDPTSCAFLEDGRLNVTLAVEEYEQGVVDFVEAYGDYDKKGYAAGELDPDILFNLYDQQFSTLRASYKFAPERAAFTSRNRVKVCAIDNGLYIAHYVKLPNDVKGYEAIGEMAEEGGWPNPGGRPCLFLVPGHWNPEAVLPEDRYSPALLALIQSRLHRDVTQSQWASRAAERPKFMAPLPPEVAVQLAQMDFASREAFFDDLESLQGDRAVLYTAGKPEAVAAAPDQFTDKLYGEQRDEAQKYMPRAAFSGTADAQALLRNAPTSTILKQDEIDALDYADPMRFKFHAFKQLLAWKDRYWRTNLHGPNKPGQKDEEKRYTLTTGTEHVIGRKVRRGQEIEQSLSDFDFNFDRIIMSVDNRASSVAARIEVLKQRMTFPNGTHYVTEEEIVTALGKENATEYLEDLRAENRYRRLSAMNDSLTLASAVRHNALTLGINEQELLLQMGAAPPQQSAGGTNGNSPYQMAPPRTDTAPVEAIG